MDGSKDTHLSYTHWKIYLQVDTMEITPTDKVINNYLKAVCRQSDPSAEYNVICAGISQVNNGVWHIDFDLFRKASNKFTLFYKITTQGDIIARNG